MGQMRSAEYFLGLEIFVLFLISIIGTSYGATTPADVAAINILYIAIGSPPLPGWVSSAGDPCGEAWQGVACDSMNNIISITLNGANLGGDLGEYLGAFSSITSIDLSNNNIGGSVPSNLPVTMQALFLSDNNLTGSIPSSISTLNQLSAMSLNDNQLTGEIPDSFEGLTLLVNLDLSSNNLSGKLPPSMQNLSALSTMHLQNNQLSGTLDVLQDLHLLNLNVENNQFNGPIPDKLLSIPNFRSNGNQFNTSNAPLSSPPSSPRPPPAPPFFGVVPTSAPTPPSSGRSPAGRIPAGRSPGKQSGKQADGPSLVQESNSKSKRNTKRIVGIAIGGVMAFLILLLALLLLLPRCSRRRRDTHRISERHEVAPYVGNRENPPDTGALVLPGHREEKESQVAVAKPREELQTGQQKMAPVPKPRIEQQANAQKMRAIPKRKDHEIDMSRFEIDLMPPPPPPPPPLPDKVVVIPLAPAEEAAAAMPSARPLPLTSVKSYTIASLQQYTNSFSQDNLIGAGMLGSVYRVELPNGKLLAVKKLDKRISNQQKDDEFLDLVNNLDRIRHANVVELMGYCSEHGQRLLVYEYCSNGSLQEALHSDDEFRKKLSWNMRIRMALGSARALEYLHEISEPPIIHRNFKSANVLLDDELAVHVSDCGLASLITSGAVSQLSGQLLTTYGYGAPEFESGVYTSKSDVYSFGVVMLELLTGRMSYDRSRNRGEQFLVRWAIPQLHDIDALTGMVDPALNGRYPLKSLSHFADIISRCVQAEPEFRPPMSEVVQDLIQMIRRESSNRSDGD